MTHTHTHLPQPFTLWSSKSPRKSATERSSQICCLETYLLETCILYLVFLQTCRDPKLLRSWAHPGAPAFHQSDLLPWTKIYCWKSYWAIVGRYWKIILLFTRPGSRENPGWSIWGRKLLIQTLIENIRNKTRDQRSWNTFKEHMWDAITNILKYIKGTDERCNIKAEKHLKAASSSSTLAIRSASCWWHQNSKHQHIFLQETFFNVDEKTISLNNVIMG